MSPHSILFVDDEQNVLSSLCRLFRKENYEVITANSGGEALEKMASKPVDIIISDQRMPLMTGVELLSEIKEKYPSTIRMVLSGYSEIKEIISAVNEGGICRFITKPWNDEQLKAAVRLAIEQRDVIYVFTEIVTRAGKKADLSREFNFETFQKVGELGVRVCNGRKNLSEDEIYRLMEFFFSILEEKDDIGSKLRIVSGAVEKQKGKVTLIADVGKGVTLSVELPVDEVKNGSFLLKADG
jgi:response regulator RpfG family c-di-GMP phosphodiesterase